MVLLLKLGLNLYIITFALVKRWGVDFTSTWERKSERLVDLDPKRRRSTVQR